MAITEAQVHEAARRIDAEGKKVSVISVRDSIGSGSYSTVAKYLATYEPVDDVPTVPVPEDLLPLFTGLWSRAIALARVDSEYVAIEARAELAAMSDRLIEALAALDLKDVVLLEAENRLTLEQTATAQTSVRLQEANKTVVVLQEELARARERVDAQSAELQRQQNLLLAVTVASDLAIEGPIERPPVRKKPRRKVNEGGGPPPNHDLIGEGV